MVCEDREEPPRLATAGAARWMRRKVARNGADPCASLVRYGRETMWNGFLGFEVMSDELGDER